MTRHRFVVVICVWKSDVDGYSFFEGAFTFVGFAVEHQFDVDSFDFLIDFAFALFVGEGDFHLVAFALGFESEQGVVAAAEFPAVAGIPIEASFGFAVFVKADKKSEWLERVLVGVLNHAAGWNDAAATDRKSTRLNSSHL